MIPFKRLPQKPGMKRQKGIEQWKCEQPHRHRIAWKANGTFQAWTRDPDLPIAVCVSVESSVQQRSQERTWFAFTFRQRIDFNLIHNNSLVRLLYRGRQNKYTQSANMKQHIHHTCRPPSNCNKHSRNTLGLYSASSSATKQTHRPVSLHITNSNETRNKI